MNSARDWWIHGTIASFQVLAVVALIAFVLWAGISATTYNASRGELCERHGLAFGSEYMGRYGCVELHPFDEFEGEQ